MRPIVGIAKSAAIVLAVAAVLIGARALASGDSDKAEIEALNQRLTEAFNRKDLNAMMACYVNDEDAVFFVDTIPFEVKGTSAWRKDNQEFFGSASQVHLGVEAIAVVVSGDLAATHSIAPLTWTDKSGAHTERGRYTQILKKISGKWLIWHEHFSVPYDPATGKAVLEAKP